MSSIEERDSPDRQLAADEEDAVSGSSRGDEDLFMFREWGRKVQEQLKKLGDAITHGMTLGGTGSAEEPTQLYVDLPSDETRLVSSAFRVPLYVAMLDDHGRLGVPVMSALLRATIVYSDDVVFNYNPNTTFTIDLQYPPARNRWRIHRRIFDIIRLHTILTFRHLQGHLPSLPRFPNQLSYLVDVTFLKGLASDARAVERRRLAVERRKALEAYFNELFFTLNMCVSVELCEFLECSALSLVVWDGGWKYKEGYLRNRVWYTQTRQRWIWRLLFGWLPTWKRYQTKWFVIRSSYIAYVDYIDQTAASEVLLCDKHFEPLVENKDSKNPLRPMTITIRNGNKKLEVRSESNTQMKYWLRDLQLLADSSPWCRSHRFGSFAPIRQHTHIRWLIDADEYFRELARCIEGAQREIYIHGWWVSPELHLLRPGASHPEARLDRLLQRKAEQGVRIYVLVFKEISISLPINSYHTKIALERLHPNIRVQRHPDHYTRGILYWAHHEKIVVVDQRIAFTGGLDLCFGRYDTHQHSLTDLAPVAEKHAELSIWTGLDYANPRIRDFRNVSQYEESLLDRFSTPRMPWHDVQLQTQGILAHDLARHFIQRWNYVKAEKAMHKEEHIPFLLPGPESHSEDEGGGEGSDMTGCRAQLVRSVGEWSMGMPVEASIMEAYLHYIENAAHFILLEHQFLISRCSDARGSPVQNRIGSALANRIVRAKEEGQPFLVLVFLPLMPAFEAALDSAEASSVRMLMQAQYASLCRGPSSILGVLRTHGITDPSEYISFFGLRTHAKLGTRHVTEQVYIHSKVLIVDDRVAIVGSANVNDRSMLGGRDSEIAVIVERDESSRNSEAASILNGEAAKVSRAVRNLRLALLAEHLDMDPSDPLLVDPLNPAFHRDILQARAASNTALYRAHFRCTPDDTVHSWADYGAFTASTEIDEAELGRIKGRIVQFPSHFMEKEDLSASMLSPEYLLPLEVYL